MVRSRLSTVFGPPFGTGFSYQPNQAGFVRNEEDLSWAAVAALVAFVQRHPRYHGRALFIFGESFAGHMAPNIAAKLAAEHPTMLHLTGMAIGDGWVDPTQQNLAFPDYAYASGLIGDEQ